MDNITQERQITKTILKTKNPQILLNILPEYFESSVNKTIFTLIQSFYNKFNDLPSIQILIEKINNLSIFNSIEKELIEEWLLKEDTLSESEFLFYKEELQKRYEDKKIRQAISDAIDNIKDGDLQNAKKVLLTQCTELENLNKEVKIIDFITDFNNRKNELLKRRNNPESKIEYLIPTKIEQLDTQLDGGLRKGEILIFLAIPGGGKSISMQDVAVSVVESGLKVALFTIEMTAEQTSYRMDSRLTQIDYRLFRRNQLTDEQLIEWEKKINTIKENQFKIISVPENCNCRLIEYELNKIKNTFIPDLIVIDYVGIMTTNEEIKNQSSMDWKYIGTIIKNIKGLALKLNIPIISASQILVGAKEKAELSYNDIGLARQQIAAHADIAIALVQTTQMESLGTMKLQFVKVREGSEVKSIEINPDFNKISLTTKNKNSINNEVVEQKSIPIIPIKDKPVEGIIKHTTKKSMKEKIHEILEEESIKNIKIYEDKTCLQDKKGHTVGVELGVSNSNLKEDEFPF